MGVGAPVERQDRQFVAVDILEVLPEQLAFLAVQFAFDVVDQFVHARIGEAGVVLAGPVVVGGRNTVRVQGAARHRFRGRDPGEHGHGVVAALGHGLAEEDAGGLVLHRDRDADLPPLAQQDLLDQFARAVAGGGADGQGQGFAGGVMAHAVAQVRPAGLVEQGGGLVGVVGVGADRRVVDPVERTDRDMGRRLLAAEELLAQGHAVQGMEQGPADPLVPQDGVLQVQVDVLVDQAGLVGDVEAVAVAFLEGQGLVDGQAELPGHHVDGAGQEVGFQGGGVLDDPHADAVEGRLVPIPGRVRLQHHVAAGFDLGDAVGAEAEAGVGRVGVEGAAVAVLGRVVLEDFAFQVGRQKADAAGVGVVELYAIDVDTVGLGVDHVYGGDDFVGLAVGDAGSRVLAEFPGEDHVVGGDRGAVAPGGVGMDPVGDGDALAAVFAGLGNGAAVPDGRQLGAEHAGQLPIVVVDRDRPQGHGQDVALGQHRIDQGMERRGELRDADSQLAGRRGRARRHRRRDQDRQGRETYRRTPPHRQTPH